MQAQVNNERETNRGMHLLISSSHAWAENVGAYHHVHVATEISCFYNLSYQAVCLFQEIRWTNEIKNRTCIAAKLIFQLLILLCRLGKR